ncbi:hypothetical protein JTB14_019441 [Gonioctena quinquepunctata]|nr:hypothetical protein JTB14_019441 [Gonioctena quinquepunctata]
MNVCLLFTAPQSINSRRKINGQEMMIYKTSNHGNILHIHPICITSIYPWDREKRGLYLIVGIDEFFSRLSQAKGVLFFGVTRALISLDNAPVPVTDPPQKGSKHLRGKSAKVELVEVSQTPLTKMRPS